MTTDPGLDVGRWLAAIPTRRSRRAYDGQPLPGAQLEEIQAAIDRFHPHGDARVVLARDVPAAFFTGIIGSYGRVTGAPAALVFIADGTSPTSAEHCGYSGEGIVLEARALGLTTCWISGSFSRSAVATAVALSGGEVVRAISPVGRAVSEPTTAEVLLYGAKRPKRRRELEEIAPGVTGWPAWAAAGVAAARLAPSAMNRQPWRFRMDDGAVVVSTSVPSLPLASARLDCGIAMLHFELGARGGGCDGAWEPLSGSEVARWRPIA